MALHPIRAAWFTRPGWSPFGAWRVHGTHQGFDHYCKAGTPIYATGNGRVSGSGWHPGGHGHFVKIAYPGSVEVSYSHMQGPTTVPWSGSVNSSTRMGTVGDTGNAAGIFWMHPTAGKLLHLHTEVRINGRLVDPIFYFNSLGGALAGDGSTPITNPQEQEHIMGVTRVYFRTENGDEWSRIGDEMTSSAGDGFEPTSDRSRAEAWIRHYGPAIPLPRSTYIATQQYWGNQYRARVARLRAETTPLHQTIRDQINLTTNTRASEIRADIGNIEAGDGSFTAADRSVLQKIRSFFAA